MDSGISLMLLGVMIVGGIIFWFMTKNDGDTSQKQKSEKKLEKKDSASTSEIKKEDVFKFMEFDKIQDDMIVQNGGKKYTMAVKCKGINYDLMSEVEQLAVEEGFITFLNTLKFPIQLYVQAQNIDLKGAINTYKENIEPIKNEFEERDLEYTKITEAFDSTQNEIDEAAQKRDEVLNVYEYANDIISYIEKMSTNKNLLQRSFYVLVSYYSSEINSSEKFTKDEIVNLCYSELYTRAQSIISALASCTVEGKILDSNELADLLYTAYNRDDKGLMNVKEALQSGFYRLYSTSNDAFSKREELLQKQIEENARIKAYQTIVDTINDGSYMSPKMEVLKVEEDTSRLANEIIRREDIPLEVKEAAQKKVVDNYREIKKEVLEQVKEEKKELYEQASRIEGIKNVNKELFHNIEANANNQNTLNQSTINNIATRNEVINNLNNTESNNTVIKSNDELIREREQSIKNNEQLKGSINHSSNENESIV